jgi:hypothetical protein
MGNQARATRDGTAIPRVRRPRRLVGRDNTLPGIHNRVFGQRPDGPCAGASAPGSPSSRALMAFSCPLTCALARGGGSAMKAMTVIGTGWVRVEQRGQERASTDKSLRRGVAQGVAPPIQSYADEGPGAGSGAFFRPAGGLRKRRGRRRRGHLGRPGEHQGPRPFLASDGVRPRQPSQNKVMHTPTSD